MRVHRKHRELWQGEGNPTRRLRSAYKEHLGCLGKRWGKRWGRHFSKKQNSEDVTEELPGPGWLSMSRGWSSSWQDRCSEATSGISGRMSECYFLDQC